MMGEKEKRTKGRGNGTKNLRRRREGRERVIEEAQILIEKGGERDCAREE